MLCVRPAGCYQTVPSVLMLGGDEFHTALQRPAGEMCIFSAGGPHLGHRPKWQLSGGLHVERCSIPAGAERQRQVELVTCRV